MGRLLACIIIILSLAYQLFIFTFQARLWLSRPAVLTNSTSWKTHASVIWNRSCGIPCPKNCGRQAGEKPSLPAAAERTTQNPCSATRTFLNHVAAILFTAAQSPVPVPFLRYLPARGKPALRRYVPCAGRTYRFWTARSRRQW